MKNNTISTEFTFTGLLKYALPSIIMMIFTSMYTIVDGLFVARFVNTDALSAVNIVFPLFTLFGAVAFMFASGGSALTAALLGQKRDEDANHTFSLIVSVVVSVAIVGAIVAYIYSLHLLKCCSLFFKAFL